jgi:hypothetical protein
MRYYFPYFEEVNGWSVAYLNHRNQVCPVMGGFTQLAAILEAASMTANAAAQAQAYAPSIHI